MAMLIRHASTAILFTISSLIFKLDDIIVTKELWNRWLLEMYHFNFLLRTIVNLKVIQRMV